MVSAWAAAIVALGLIALLKGPSARMEGILDDFRHWTWMVLRGPTENDVPAPVTVIDVDERTLRALGVYGEQYREHHAKIADFLTRNGAGAVVFDVLFKTSDSGNGRLRRTLSDLRRAGWPVPSDAGALERLRNRLDLSRRLEESVARSPRAVVAAQFGNRQDYPNPSDWIPRASRAWQESTWTGVPLAESQLAGLRARAALDNIYPALARSARNLGLANVEPDPDGTMRRVQLLWRFPDSAISDEASGPARPAAYPALSLSAALVLTGRPADGFELESSRLRLGPPLRIWRDTSGTLRTSAPELTWEMCEDLLASRAGLDSIRRARAGRLEPTRQLWIQRGEGGDLKVALAYPDSLDDARTRALAALALDTALLSRVASSTEPVRVTDSVAASASPEGLSLVRGSGDSADPGPTLDPTTVGRLLPVLGPLARTGWKALPPGSNLRITSWIETWWDPVRRRLASSIPALRGSSFDALLRLDPARVESLGSGDTLELGAPLEIPLDGHGATLVPFEAPSQWEDRGPDQAWIRHVSYLDVLEGRYDPAQVPGRIFVLGSSAPALADFVDVPVQRRHPGVNVQAMEALALAWGDGLRPTGAGFDLGLSLLAATLVGLATILFTPMWAMGTMFAAIVAVFAGSVAAFDRGIWTGLLAPLLSIPFSLVAVLAVRYVLEEKQRQFLHSAFRTYIPEEVIEDMVASGNLPQLGGEVREITAFFSDIQGFSTFSEMLSAADLVELVNEYLNAMTGILKKERGSLDKYIGDAIVAMFGAPAPLDDHQRRSLLAAVEMQARLAELREKWKNEGSRWPEIVHRMRARIGVHSGRIVTGNMGSDLRMMYTMMGDDVNLAARLEGACKHYGIYVMTTSTTLGAAGPGFLTRELDLLRVVGREEPVVVHEVVGLEADAPDSWKECFGIFGEGLSLYRAGEFASARDRFLRSAELEPLRDQPGCKTDPSRVFAARCLEMAAHPPADWDGVHTATEK
jgi:adenylate cyclase